MSLPATIDLAGRTALVTGAGSPTGIGFASARALGELGARVVVTATTDRIHERAAELVAEGFDAVGVVARLDSEHEVAALAARAGAVDVLVNNAGMVSV
ncbi:MAG TPA: SDR family NAD(P)-dependent oxidoreductase, partial [Microbacterium sp.]|nr:SDR family NAD(P)-dependent oxidoreductase [Microbacterium sp.]